MLLIWGWSRDWCQYQVGRVMHTTPNAGFAEIAILWIQNSSFVVVDWVQNKDSRPYTYTHSKKAVNSEAQVSKLRTCFGPFTNFLVKYHVQESLFSIEVALVKGCNKYFHLQIVEGRNLACCWYHPFRAILLIFAHLPLVCMWPNLPQFESKKLGQCGVIKSVWSHKLF